MSEHSKHSSSADPHQHHPASGRGRGSHAGTNGSPSHPSTSSGRSSSESDTRPCDTDGLRQGKPLTMGSNGGGMDSEIEQGREQGRRQTRTAHAPETRRNAS